MHNKLFAIIFAFVIFSLIISLVFVNAFATKNHNAVNIHEKLEKLVPRRKIEIPKEVTKEIPELRGECTTTNSECLIEKESCINIACVSNDLDYISDYINKASINH